MTALALIVAAFTIVTVVTQGFIMAKLDTIASQIDILTTAFNDETNALAARIDAFEVAAGGTVTQAQVDALKAISDRLKSLGAPAEPVVDAAADAPPVTKSVAPKASSDEVGGAEGVLVNAVDVNAVDTGHESTSLG